MMPEFGFVYDGIASMLAILLDGRNEQDRPLAKSRGYPEYFHAEGTSCRLSRRIPELLMNFRTNTPMDGHMVDGLRVDWPDRWFHVRVSQTEPIVRVICEQRGAAHGAVREPGERVRRLT